MPMEQFEMLVPTYYGMMYAKMDPHENKEDFGEPNVPVLIRHAEGVRVVLGTHNFNDMDKPDIQIERRPNGWAIFLHPVGGGDASGLVYFLDDGRSYIVPDGLPSEEIRFTQFTEEVPLIDDPPVDASLPEPLIVTTGQSNSSQRLEEALAQAEAALAGDSNDAEHDALLALVEAICPSGPKPAT
ncbi:MAG: hypothetical protein L0Y71_03100 [Gemmataceae bacterium]|nr:hypothetical protein [Gemmataceae bacterium]